METQERLKNLEKRVWELESREGIRDAIARYSWAIDTEDWASLGEAFTKEGVCVNKWRSINYIGREAIVEFFRLHRAKFKFTNRISNLNERITVTGKTGKASSYILVMYTINGESRIGWGTYEWEMAFEDGLWRTKRLIIDVTLMTTLERGWGMETDRVLKAPALDERK